MNKTNVKKPLAVAVFLLFLSISVIPSTGTTVVDKTTISTFHDGNTLYVGGNGTGNYSKIQDAIDNASDGDTVFVYDDSSPYYEHVVVDKSINLFGENRDTTVIYGSGYEDVVYVSTNGVKIIGFTISSEDFGNGIFICSNYNTIIGNTITNNIDDGIWLNSSEGNIIADNYISLCLYYGIRLYYSNNNTITGNIFKDNDAGINLWYYNNINIITNNTFFNDGLSLRYSYNNIIENNTVNGKPLVYLQDETDKIINDAGQVILVNCNNITLENLNISNTCGGIQLWGTNNSLIRNNNCSNNYISIEFEYSSGNTIIGNNILNNHVGLWLIISNNNNIQKNNFIDNVMDVDFHIFLKNLLFKRNIWRHNYWDEVRILPKPIFGVMLMYPHQFPWLQFDWRPASEPYDI